MPTKRLQRGLRATLLGMVLNTILAAGKMAAGILGHSHALVADAVESLADIFSSIVVWRGLVVAEEPPDEDHPYGHGKAEAIAAATVSAMLLLAAAGIGMKSIQELISGRPPGQGPRAFTLIILIAVIAIKETLFRYVNRAATDIESTAMRADAWHHRSDAITSLAAAIGITIALIGGKKYEGADDIAAIVAAVIIAFNGILLIRPALSELMDESAKPEVIAAIRRTASAVEGVEQVEKCMVRKSGPRYLVDMHLEVNPEITVRQGHQIAHHVKDTVMQKHPAVEDVLVHIEPSGQSHKLHPKTKP